MATSLSKLTLRKEQLAVLSNYDQFGFAQMVTNLISLNQLKKYTETPFQLALRLDQLLTDLEGQKGAYATELESVQLADYAM
jgi:hypothetical protein